MQGDIFSGLNDGLLSRAEALAAVDIGKHHGVGVGVGVTAAGVVGQSPQLKHDMLAAAAYHHNSAVAARSHHQVHIFIDIILTKSNERTGSAIMAIKPETFVTPVVKFIIQLFVFVDASSAGICENRRVLIVARCVLSLDISYIVMNSSKKL